MRVLLVDDEPDIRTIAKLSLEAVGGFDVELAASGAAAIEMASRHLPDVILLDVMMPVLDGPATLARLRAIDELRAVPVVFMTAKVQKHEIERFIALGALAVIAKPFDPMTLSAQVAEILATHRTPA